MSAESESVPATADAKDVCHVCACGAPAKYRCAKCAVVRYCSSECYKSHTEVCGGKSEQECGASDAATGQSEPVVWGEVGADALAPALLQLLDESPSLRSQLCGSRHLRELIAGVDGASKPADALRAAMADTEFEKFARTCLSLVENEPAYMQQEQTDDKSAVTVFKELLQEALGE